ATKLGGELMMQPDSIGQIAPNFYADFVLLDGDPLQDLKLLQDPNKILLVMKDGEIVKSCKDHEPVSSEIHLSAINEATRDVGVREALYHETH
ncbi:cytosine deaminase, partial [Robbsia andropogonis]